MPITSSAKKALRQSFKKKARNLQAKKAWRTLLKQFREAVAKKDSGAAKKLMPQVMKALDKAAKAGVIKKNTASRLKSRSAKSVAKLS